VVASLALHGMLRRVQTAQHGDHPLGGHRPFELCAVREAVMSLRCRFASEEYAVAQAGSELSPSVGSPWQRGRVTPESMGTAPPSRAR